VATITLKFTGNFPSGEARWIGLTMQSYLELQGWKIYGLRTDVKQLHINELQTKSASEIAHATLLDDAYHTAIQQAACLLHVKGLGSYVYATSNGDGAERTTRWYDPDNSKAGLCVTATGTIQR
jgi:hypothetical protein